MHIKTPSLFDYVHLKHEVFSLELGFELKPEVHCLDAYVIEDQGQ